MWLRVDLVPILVCCSLVLSLELINTAVEATVDLASPELHPLAKRAKDFAAAAVLIAVLFSTLVGLLALGPPLVARIWSLL
jgi:diacylglycerol kinase (ATP)